jgi:dihydrofolate reductase
MCRGHESSPPSLQVVLVLVEPSVALIPEATIVPTWTPRPRRTFNQEEDHVGRIVVTEFVSLDGVMEDPGGAENFRHGGWSFEISRGDEGNKFKLDETVSSEALLLGRVTYEGFAAAWPSREGEFADKFNAMPKYVVSSTLEEPEWNNSTVLKGDVADEVAKLREEHEGDIVVHGSATLVQTLLERDLVDELRLMVFPVVLGSGKRVFDELSDKKPLRLIDSKVVGDGVAILVYEPASAAESG